MLANWYIGAPPSCRPHCCRLDMLAFHPQLSNAGRGLELVSHCANPFFVLAGQPSNLTSASSHHFAESSFSFAPPKPCFRSSSLLVPITRTLNQPAIIAIPHVTVLMMSGTRSDHDSTALRPYPTALPALSRPRRAAERRRISGGLRARCEIWK